MHDKDNITHLKLKFLESYLTSPFRPSRFLMNAFNQRKTPLDSNACIYINESTNIYISINNYNISLSFHSKNLVHALHTIFMRFFYSD